MILTREEASFGDAEHKARREKALVVGDQAHQCHYTAPGKDDAGEEEPRCQTLQQSVREWLEKRVRNEEDCERHIVLGAFNRVRIAYHNSRHCTHQTCLDHPPYLRAAHYRCSLDRGMIADTWQTFSSL